MDTKKGVKGLVGFGVVLMCALLVAAATNTIETTSGDLTLDPAGGDVVVDGNIDLTSGGTISASSGDLTLSASDGDLWLPERIGKASGMLNITGGTGRLKVQDNNLKYWSTAGTNSSSTTPAMSIYDYHNNAGIRGGLLGFVGSGYELVAQNDFFNIIYYGKYASANAGYLVLSPAAATGKGLTPSATNTLDLGTTALRWKNGYIKNAWTVGDLVFGFNGLDYRMVEAEKITNNKLRGLMFVFDGEATVWIEPSGKIHTKYPIDDKWSGISGLSFDDNGGVYKEEEVVKYPEWGEDSSLPIDYIDNKAAYVGDDKISAPLKKPSRYVEKIKEDPFKAK